MKKTFFYSLLILFTNLSYSDVYVVQEGDTLSSIAHAHCVDTGDLRRANNLSLFDSLQIGQKIALPDDGCKKSKNGMFSLGGSKKNFITSVLSSATLPLNADKFLGKRYVWGAVGPNVFDCSGFTSYLYKKVGITLPRTAAAQFESGKRVAREDLKRGDLVFFDTEKRMTGRVNHVGMYIGNNQFIHASSGKHQVTIGSLEGFYSQRFMGARRYLS